MVYKATVETQEGSESYTGLTEKDFKSRWSNHKHLFQNEEQKNATELSKHVWKLHDRNINHRIKWDIIGRARPYSNQSKQCNLCLLEKYHIICVQENATLNKKSELVSTCRHTRKFLLSTFKNDPV